MEPVPGCDADTAKRQKYSKDTEDTRPITAIAPAFIRDFKHHVLDPGSTD